MSNTPIVSIVIPCRNEEAYISGCLDSIINAEYPLDKLEVFVCDGKSTDQTQKIIREYHKRYPFIHLLLNKHKTTPFALNLGIRNSKGQVIIILGAHAEIDKNYIRNCVEVLNNDPETGCTGGIIKNIHENKTSEIISHAMSSGFGVGNAHFRTGSKEGYVDTVAFGAYKKEVIEQIGLFDEDLHRNQDDEYNYRLTSNGYKIYLSKNIISNYYVRGSYRKLFKQYYQYGYWKVLVNKKHKTITTQRQLIPLFFVLYLYSFVIALFYFPFIYLYLAVLVAYLLLAFYFAFRKTNKFITAMKIVFSFFILHYSYGLGYLEGLVHFFLLNKKPGNKKANLTRILLH